jgi:hypothetical protein
MTALQQAIQDMRNYELEAPHGSHRGFGVVELRDAISVLETMEIRLRNECEAEKAMQTLKEEY